YAPLWFGLLSFRLSAACSIHCPDHELLCFQHYSAISSCVLNCSWSAAAAAVQLPVLPSIQLVRAKNRIVRRTT
ncbi:hypothetical protein COO60DRAFT_1562619, partial [Scenedesmus sp. NREL 46B-D3]